jgi:hypothetical protein
LGGGEQSFMNAAGQDFLNNTTIKAQTMDSLLADIWQWFLPKQEYFVAFAEADSRIEGWFKAEMIVLLNRLIQQGKLEKFEREFNIAQGGQRNQIDFRLHIQGQAHLCELKAMCISQAAGTPRNLHFYFRDDHVGVIKDFKKLDGLTSQEKKWALTFVYPSPVVNEWHNTITSLPNELKHWQCLTQPQNYPTFAFPALWRQGQKLDR